MTAKQIITQMSDHSSYIYHSDHSSIPVNYHPISDCTITQKSDHKSITSMYHPVSDCTIIQKSDHKSITSMYHPVSDYYHSEE